MRLAIDVGNTHTVYGLHDGVTWVAVWRRATSISDTEDELAAWLFPLFEISGIPFRVEDAVCGSVVPGVNDAIAKLAEKHFRVPLRFLRRGDDVGLRVTYDPPHAVGADRLANALAALARFAPPIVVVDFGTATTFDTIDRDGSYIGGVILPGVKTSANALFAHAAKLPAVEFTAPEFVIGRNTVDSIRSGIMFGYASAVDGLASRINAELGGDATILATGGLGGIFMGLCTTISSYEPTLTLDGLRIAADRLRTVAESG